MQAFPSRSLQRSGVSGNHHCRLQKQSLSCSWRQGVQGQPTLLQPLFFLEAYKHTRKITRSTRAKSHMNAHEHSALLVTVAPICSTSALYPTVPCHVLLTYTHAHGISISTQPFVLATADCQQNKHALLCCTCVTIDHLSAFVCIVSNRLSYSLLCNSRLLVLSQHLSINACMACAYVKHAMSVRLQLQMPLNPYG